MTKVFSVASWNVEHFKDDPARVGRAIDFLQSNHPDVFGIYEVEGASVFDVLVQKMPGYIFQVTEGPETQEILVGVRHTLSGFITQKIEFRSGTSAMRPGQLVTVRKKEINYSLLFLHLASGDDPRGMGLRDDMLQRAFDFRRTLDAASGCAGQARYLFMGDLNTMGMNYPFERSIDAATEILKWDRYAARTSISMRRLAKTHDATWNNGSASRLPPSDLDHVYASANLAFRDFKRADGALAQVAVRGWVDADNDTDRDTWIASYSDHSLLYFEVTG